MPDRPDNHARAGKTLNESDLPAPFVQWDEIDLHDDPIYRHAPAPGYEDFTQGKRTFEPPHKSRLLLAPPNARLLGLSERYIPAGLQKDDPEEKGLVLSGTKHKMFKMRGDETIYITPGFGYELDESCESCRDREVKCVVTDLFTPRLYKDRYVLVQARICLACKIRSHSCKLGPLAFVFDVKTNKRGVIRNYTAGLTPALVNGFTDWQDADDVGPGVYEALHTLKSDDGGASVVDETVRSGQEDEVEENCTGEEAGACNVDRVSDEHTTGGEDQGGPCPEAGDFEDAQMNSGYVRAMMLTADATQSEFTTFYEGLSEEDDMVVDKVAKGRGSVADSSQADRRPVQEASPHVSSGTLPDKLPDSLLIIVIRRREKFRSTHFPAQNGAFCDYIANSEPLRYALDSAGPHYKDLAQRVSEHFEDSLIRFSSGIRQALFSAKQHAEMVLDFVNGLQDCVSNPPTPAEVHRRRRRRRVAFADEQAEFLIAESAQMLRKKLPLYLLRVTHKPLSYEEQGSGFWLFTETRNWWIVQHSLRGNHDKGDDIEQGLYPLLTVANEETPAWKDLQAKVKTLIQDLAEVNPICGKTHKFLDKPIDPNMRPLHVCISALSVACTDDKEHICDEHLRLDLAIAFSSLLDAAAAAAYEETGRIVIPMSRPILSNRISGFCLTDTLIAEQFDDKVKRDFRDLYFSQMWSQFWESRAVPKTEKMRCAIEDARIVCWMTLESKVFPVTAFVDNGVVRVRIYGEGLSELWLDFCRDNVSAIYDSMWLGTHGNVQPSLNYDVRHYPTAHMLDCDATGGNLELLSLTLFDSAVRHPVWIETDDIRERMMGLKGGKITKDDLFRARNIILNALLQLGSLIIPDVTEKNKTSRAVKVFIMRCNSGNTYVFQSHAAPATKHSFIHDLFEPVAAAKIQKEKKKSAAELRKAKKDRMARRKRGEEVFTDEEL